MRRYGYIRVSSREQNEDRQLNAIMAEGVPKHDIFIDKQSGKDFKRPAWLLVVNKLEEGDLVYIRSIDRLGRNYDEIIEQWRIITKEKRADIVVIDMPLLDTRIKERDLTGRLIADLVLQILSYVAQSERDNTLLRQAEGIVAAKARGVQFGPPASKPPKNFIEIIKLREEGRISLRDALIQTNLSQSTYYRHLKKYQKKE
jgi:DNA invertase Pin-like site-specific DNA recombinase